MTKVGVIRELSENDWFLFEYQKKCCVTYSGVALITSESFGCFGLKKCTRLICTKRAPSETIIAI